MVTWLTRTPTFPFKVDASQRAFEADVAEMRAQMAAVFTLASDAAAFARTAAAVGSLLKVTSLKMGLH